MAEGGALREIAARFGIEIDDAQLKAFVKEIDGAKKKLTEVAPKADHVAGDLTRVGREGGRAHAGLQQFAAGLRTTSDFATRWINRMRDGFSSLGATLLGGALVYGAREFAREFSEAAGNVHDTADRLGLATDELQELRHAANMGGIGAEQLDAALTNLNRGLTATGSSATPVQQALAALGIRARNTDGSMRNVADLTDDIAEAFDRIEDPSRRAALATQLYGGAGARLVTILRSGEGGVAALRAELRELGGGLSTDGIEAAQRFGDAMNRWKVASDSFRSLLATALLPRLADLVAWVTRGIATFTRMARGTEVVKLGLIALAAVAVVAGLAVAASWAPVLIPVLAIAAWLAYMVLLVDDLITLFRGGDSVIGRFIDNLLGAGTAARAVGWVKQAFHDVVAGARAAWATVQSTWRSVREGASSARDAVVGFATRISDQVERAFGRALAAGRGLFTSLREFFAELGGLVTDLGNRIWQALVERFQRAVAAIGGVVRRVAGALGIDLDDAVQRAIAAAGTVADGAREVAGGVREGAGVAARRVSVGALDVVRGVGEGVARTAAATAQVTQSATARVREARTFVRQSHDTHTYQINGAQDPRAVADELERRQRERAADERDAEFPLRPEGD